MTRRLALALACALTTAAACDAEQAPPTPADTPRLVTDTGEVRALDGEYRDVAALAARTLAERLELPEEAITVDTVKPVEWRDTSLGCPQPGIAYGQVITPGHRITLRAGGRLYFVHEADGRALVCDDGKAVVGVGGDGQIVWTDQAAAARADLAAHLGAKEDDIRIVGARTRTWPDRALGCPQPGVDYAEGPVEGYEIILRRAGRDYTYHTDLEQVIPCPPITSD